ncbi:MAG: hypothetical protein ACD_3C00199G0002 [uncultured bacterium (gcode 4)]|uniref:Uncharacterized protein n=1 Tax=uncultured bacterium (gcode 4) TaxID=1234023 RepID=K2F8K3_9BACT|nr:MAG: hypothetical protein ACD_3C00199G0002 [uncultured bacterium (gcode 4)]
MDKKTFLVIISSILLIFLAFFYWMESNKTILIEWWTKWQINTNIIDSKWGEF